MDAGSDDAVAVSAHVDDLVDRCRWVADAFEADDAWQVAPALAALYQVLALRGWIPPARAAILLRLQPALADAELSELSSPPPRCC